MIRRVVVEDRELYLTLSGEFYASDAVDHAIPLQHRLAAFEEMMRSDEYALGFIIEDNGAAAGYALLAKTFSQEAGGIVYWIEELYIRPEYRSHGLGREFFAWLQQNLAPYSARLRLEVEEENIKAIKLYQKLGFKQLAYLQFIQDQQSRGE